MKFYHRTDKPDPILEGGFKDGYRRIAGIDFKGVFLSDVPVDANEGAAGKDLLCIEIPDDDVSNWEFDLDEHGELKEKGNEKRYREWNLPAEIVNRYPVRLVSVEEEESLPFLGGEHLKRVQIIWDEGTTVVFHAHGKDVFQIHIRELGCGSTWGPPESVKYDTPTDRFELSITPLSDSASIAGPELNNILRKA